MTDPVLVMGITGKTGAAVARALLGRGVRVRGVSRTPTPDGAPEGVEVVAADLATGRGLFPALDGVRVVHHSAPNLSVDEVAMMRNLVERARSAGVERIVFHSVMHPYAPGMPHHLRKAEAEHVLRTSGLGWTILQPAAYHQNLHRAAYAGRLAVPYALDRPFSNVDLADVAEVAARVAVEGTGLHGTFELAGPEERDVAALADEASAVLGREITAARVPAPTGTDRETRELRAMFEHYDAHGFVGAPLALEALLGRRPTTWAQSLERSLSTKEKP